MKRLAFSPDGSKLLSAGPDGAALVWDLFGRHARKPVAAPDAKAIAGWWETLALDDAMLADPVMRAMAAHPDAALKLLREKLPGVVVEPAVIDALIVQLGDRDFATREAATKKLMLISAAESKLAVAAEKSESAEVRELAELVLKRLRRINGLQAERAIEVLEWIGSPESRKFLEELTSGTADARLKKAVEGAIARLKVAVK